MKYAASKPPTASQASRRTAIAAPDGKRPRAARASTLATGASVPARPADPEPVDDAAVVLTSRPPGSDTSACQAPQPGARRRRAARRGSPAPARRRGSAEQQRRARRRRRRARQPPANPRSRPARAPRAPRRRARRRRCRRATRSRRRRPRRRSQLGQQRASVRRQRVGAVVGDDDDRRGGRQLRAASRALGARLCALGSRGLRSRRSRAPRPAAAAGRALRQHLVLVGQARDHQREVQQQHEDERRASRTAPTARSRCRPRSRR